MITTDVLIVGAGPVGLMAANQLARFGIDFVIIDSKAAPTLESRAMAVSPRSMELYDQLNLAQTILEDTSDIQGLYIYNNGHQKANIDFTNAGYGISDFPRIMYGYEQFKNEKLLYHNLTHHGHGVMWNTEYIEHQDINSGLIVITKSVTTSQKETIHAKYIIGCDGGRSSLRHNGDFSFDGGEYENKFFVADVKIKWDERNLFGINKVIVEPSNDHFDFFFPLKEENSYRAMGSLPTKFNNKQELTQLEVLETIKNSTSLKLVITEVNWHSTYRIHHRYVNHFSSGRVYLAGDAAHLHSPVGGQGMNIGLQDVHNLTWKLAMVIKGTAKPKLLETYNSERIGIAKMVVNTTDKAFQYITSKNFVVSFVRQKLLFSFMNWALKYNQTQKLFFNKLTQIGNSYSKSDLSASDTNQVLKFKAGDRLPWVNSGFLGTLSDPIFHLIVIGKSELTRDDIASYEYEFPFPIKIIHTTKNDWLKYGVTQNLFILVRPDHHIAYLADTLSTRAIKDKLQKYFFV
jgi:2-polyprenyl-6-methoxyphenol hydroxylase-like FAD-dependent oxidoreductase